MMKRLSILSCVSLVPVASLIAGVLAASPVLAQRPASGDSAPFRANPAARAIQLPPRARTLIKLRTDRKSTTTQTKTALTLTNPNRNAGIKSLKVPLLIERLDLPGSNAQPAVEIQKAEFATSGFATYTGMFDVEVKNTVNHNMSEIATVYIQVLAEYSIFDYAKYNQTHNFDSMEKKYEPVFFDTASLGKLKGLEKKVVSFDLKEYQPKSIMDQFVHLENWGKEPSGNPLKNGDKFFTGYTVECGLIIGDWP